MIEVTGLNKTFRLKSGDVNALRDVTLRIEDGQVYGVIGYSGAGKSTLVRCLNLLELPDSGSVRIGDVGFEAKDGRIFSNGAIMKERARNRMRRGIGMIFQHFNLLDRSTVYENIAYPLKHTGMTRSQISERVFELLELVGLTDKANVYPSQLSGGQKQRVAIARALANRPEVLLCDEATSALDPDATEAILELLKDLNRKLRLTIVLITHEMAVIKSICQRVAVMEDGRVVEEGDVYSIFSHPTAGITRRFIASASALSKADKLIAEGSPLVRTKPGESLIRITFRRESVGEHMITSTARSFDVDVNIVLASVEELQGSALGGVIAIFSGERENVQRALKFLNDNYVETEVLANGSGQL